MSESTKGEGSCAVSAVLLVGRDAFDRFDVIVRHLTVGLIDQAVHVRAVSTDRRVESLRLGPVQVVLYETLRRPWVRRRAAELIESLAQPVPTVVHALSADVYSEAITVAEAYDADLVLQVSCLADRNAVAPVVTRRDTRFMAVSQPLAEMLEQQCRIPRDRIDLIRPGVLASESIACFSHPERTPTLLCTSAFEKGRGIDELLSALTVLQSKAAPSGGMLTFLMGRGRMESSLRRLVRELGLSASVIFAHPTCDAAQAMKNSDVFVLPAATDAFDADSLQAMGAGMAVVSAPSPVCDHFIDGKTAIVCETPSAAGIADAVGRLLQDHDYAQRIAAGALEHVRSQHAMSAMAEGVGGVYRKLAMKRATFPIAE